MPRPVDDRILGRRLDADGASLALCRVAAVAGHIFHDTALAACKNCAYIPHSLRLQRNQSRHRGSRIRGQR